MNITVTLPSDKLPIFSLKPNLDPQTRVFGGQNPRVYSMIDRLRALRMREKTGTDFKFGFKFPVGGSVPVPFISMIGIRVRIQVG